jgi:formylglycine-generating enzyme required for sulfatase activity
MRDSCLFAASALALLASTASTFAAETKSDGPITIPAGLYTPFFRVKAPNEVVSAANALQPIPAFRLDVEPVTNAKFLDFVAAHPEWRKSRVKPLFADSRYLQRWPADLELGDALARDEPVTNVSWFAAQAYCRARGMRLPTTKQWEYALADKGRNQDDVRSRSLEWLASPNEKRPPPVGGPPNAFGISDMVGLIWEWTLDFDAYATTAESRDPNGKDSAFCGGAAAGVADATDYPAFMRYSMRASLKADYTADNLGFRCALGPS